MNERFRFDPEKALEVLLYVSSSCSNMYNALKVLYFADRAHLAEYGRLIWGESYVAMAHGPVPSGAYDMVKSAKPDSLIRFDIDVRDSLLLNGNEIVPLREPNLEWLSESDIEALDHSLAEYGDLSFGELKTISHQDTAFKAADENDFIPFEALVRSLPDGELLLNYLSN
ncbi:MAG: SocA family protein [Chloroflexi bacterium]|nr:SocA family protein [Chloroflexota bacterium]